MERVGRHLAPHRLSGRVQWGSPGHLCSLARRPTSHGRTALAPSTFYFLLGFTITPWVRSSAPLLCFVIFVAFDEGRTQKIGAVRYRD